jgi:hypothetical protein
MISSPVQLLSTSEANIQWISSTLISLKSKTSLALSLELSASFRHTIRSISRRVMTIKFRFQREHRSFIKSNMAESVQSTTIQGAGIGTWINTSKIIAPSLMFTLSATATLGFQIVYLFGVLQTQAGISDIMVHTALTSTQLLTIVNLFKSITTPKAI